MSQRITRNYQQNVEKNKDRNLDKFRQFNLILLSFQVLKLMQLKYQKLHNLLGILQRAKMIVLPSFSKIKFKLLQLIKIRMKINVLKILQSLQIQIEDQRIKTTLFQQFIMSLLRVLNRLVFLQFLLLFLLLLSIILQAKLKILMSQILAQAQTLLLLVCFI